MVQKIFYFFAPLRNEIMFKNSKPAPLRQKILATPLPWYILNNISTLRELGKRGSLPYVCIYTRQMGEY